MNLDVISTKKSLPEYDEEVFLVGLNSAGKRRWFIGRLISTDSKGHHWKSGNVEIRDVTHYAYKPPIPKVIKAEKLGD